MAFAKIFTRLLIAAALCGGAYLVYRAFSRYTFAEIMEALGALPPWRIAVAIGFAAASYLCLTFFDFLALRSVGRPLAYHRAALASFVSLSIGHNVGFAALSSGAIRFRFYSRWGLSASQVAKVVIFCGLTVGLGLTSIGGIGLLLYPSDATLLMEVRRSVVAAIGIACLAAPALYLFLAAMMRRPVRLWKWSLELPPFSIAAAQVAIGTANFACVAACLHQLISAFALVPYPKTAAVYVTAQAAALASHAPGGIGVLEASVLYLLPNEASIGAVIAFRVIYFFVPIAFGLPLFLISEYLLRSVKRARSAK